MNWWKSFLFWAYVLKAILGSLLKMSAISNWSGLTRQISWSGLDAHQIFIDKCWGIRTVHRPVESRNGHSACNVRGQTTQTNHKPNSWKYNTSSVLSCIILQDYKAAELPYTLNPTTLIIDFFALIGWAYDRRSVSAETIKARKMRTGWESLNPEQYVETEHPYWNKRWACVNENLLMNLAMSIWLARIWPFGWGSV